jgi:methylmalonyl-CoA/ethylmalonyl-CoA epimerase
MKLDHIGIAVDSIEEALKTYQSIGFHVEDIVTISEQKVRLAILPIGESRIELLEPTGANSVIQKFLKEKGQGIHHLCFEVENLEQKVNELKQTGVLILDQVPCRGYEDRKVAFLHPKTTHGVLIELVEERNASSGFN